MPEKVSCHAQGDLKLNFQIRTLAKQPANLFGCEIAVGPQHTSGTQ